MQGRQLLGLAAGGMAAVSLPVIALQRTTVFRVAHLSGGSGAANKPQIDAFRKSMRALGYIEGTRFVLEERYAEGKFERLPFLAQELIQRKPDLILASTLFSALSFGNFVEFRFLRNFC